MRRTDWNETAKIKETRETQWIDVDLSYAGEGSLARRRVPELDTERYRHPAFATYGLDRNSEDKGNTRNAVNSATIIKKARFPGNHAF